jgi:hypothetical protein
MTRRIVIRLSAVLLIVNGLAGLAAAWVGWTATSTMLEGLRQTSASTSTQQTRLVTAVDGVAVGVDDVAQATAGLSVSTTRARNAVTDAKRTADDLAGTFEQLSQASRVTVLGVRPLEGLAQPFGANADDFRRLGASLSDTADSLADNARDVTRVGDDLKRIQAQLDAAAREIEALQAAPLIRQGLGGLELGSHLLLGFILFEAVVSALTGLALLMLASPFPIHAPAPLSLPPPKSAEPTEGAEGAAIDPRQADDG